MQPIAPTPAPHSSTAPAALFVAPVRDVGGQGEVLDGGFHERLRKILGSDTVHGVPGSGTPLVAGIHLQDPDKHGIAAVMRQGQRLFGITSHHCLDVQVWRQLTPRELGARYLSPRDLDRMAEKYHCNSPMGLSF